MKILLLLGDRRRIGGIQRYTDDLVNVLSASPGVDLRLTEFVGEGLFAKIRFGFHAIASYISFRPRIVFCSHIHFAGFGYWFRFFGAPYAVFTYGIDAWNMPPRHRWYLQRAERIVAISRFTKKKIEEQIGANPEVFLLPNAIDGERFYPQPKPQDLLRQLQLLNKKVIFTLSRLSSLERYKGYEEILRALSRVKRVVPEVAYILAGDGDDLPRIQQLIVSLELGDDVRLPGRIPAEELVRYYNACDVFVMPSKREGFGFVFLEALACGKPVIAGNEGGAPEAVLGGEVGVLVNPDAVDDIADAVIRVLEGKVPARLLNRSYLRRRVLEEYGEERFREGIGRLLRALASGDASCRAIGAGTERPADFMGPTHLPASPDAHRRWQSAIAAWWERHPMRYDWRQEIFPAEFSKNFYQEIDSRFFSNAREYLPGETVPFDTIIPFDSLRGKDVLEIGIGNGSHAGLLSRFAKSFTGIDITKYAVTSVKRRFEIFRLRGKIIRMDAEDLQFPDNIFDFIWSWGVIDHAANTENILREMRRVLRPGGTAVTMVYYRGWWTYYCVGFLRGLLSGDLFKTHSLHKSIQRRTDGPLARYYTITEWRALAGNFFSVSDIKILGPKTDVIPLPRRAITNPFFNLLPAAYNRFLVGKLLMGSFLVATMTKNESIR